MKVMKELDQQVVKEALATARDRKMVLFADYKTKEEQWGDISPILKKEIEYIDAVVVALDNLEWFNWQHETHVY